jgi:hypothetical protein
MALNASIDLTVNKPDFKSMKAEIRELTVAAQQAVMQFGEFSPEAIKAEKALAQARDRMEDFNDRVKAVNPDKFAQLNTVVSGVARGFQAAQGAMALFGNQSEELEKTMVKLQGAMALAEGLEGLGKVQQQFGAIAKNIKGGVMSAFKALGNMSTLAFGAIGIALTLIIANFDTLKKAVMSLIPGLGSMVKFVGGLVQQFTDWVGITSAQDRALAKLNKTTEKANDQLDREIALLKARGDEVGVFNKERQKLENDLALARASYGKNNEKNWGKIIDDTKNALQILDIEEQNYHKNQSQAQNDANTEAANKRKSDKAKQLADEIQRQQELEALRVRAQDQLISAELSANEAARAVRLAQTTDKGEQLQVEYENQLAALKEAQIQEQIQNADNAEALALIDQKYANLQILATEDLNKKELDLQQQVVDAQKKIDDDKIANDKKNLDELQAIEDAKRQIVVDSLMGTLQILQDLNSQHDTLSEAAAKKSFERAKALSIAEALISTYFTAQKAYEGQFKPADSSSPIRGAIAAGVAVAQGLAKVAIIKNKNYKSKSEGSASTSSGMSSGGMTQISAPRVSSTLPQVNGFDQRVYVTEGDISRTQGRVASLKKVSVTQ